MGRSNPAQIHHNDGSIYFTGDIVEGGDDRVVQVEYVTKAWDGRLRSGNNIRPAVVATDGKVYYLSELSKHSKYFEAQLHNKFGIEPGGLITLHWDESGWKVGDLPK